MLLSESRNEIQHFVEDTHIEDSIIKKENIPGTVSNLSMENINFESTLPLSVKSKSETNLLLENQLKFNKSLSDSSINGILLPEKCLLSINSQLTVSGSIACDYTIDNKNETFDNAIILPAQEMEQGLENICEEQNLNQSINVNSMYINSTGYDKLEPESLEPEIENIDQEVDSTKREDRYVLPFF